MIVADLFAKLGLRVDKKAFTAGDRLINGIKGALVGVASFKGVTALRGMISDVSDAADRYNKMAKAVGISSEALQGLDFAAQLSGADVNVLVNSLQRFGRNADAANRGAKVAKESFKELGIEFKDADGNLRQTDDLLNDVADVFQRMPDGTQKTALAINLFGRQGAKLIPLLNEGSAGIQRMQMEFKDLGGLMSTETGAQFEAFNDEQLKLQTAIGGIRKQLVIALLPILRKITGRMLEWVKANRKLLSQRLTTVFKLFIKTLVLFGKVLGFVIDNWKALVIAITSVKLASIILGIAAAMSALKIASVGAALASAAAWAAAALPLVLISLLIAAIILIVEDLWRAFTGGKSVFKELWLAAKEFIADGINKILTDLSQATVEFLVPGAREARLEREAQIEKLNQEILALRRREMNAEVAIDRELERADRILRQIDLSRLTDPLPQGPGFVGPELSRRERLKQGRAELRRRVRASRRRLGGLEAGTPEGAAEQEILTELITAQEVNRQNLRTAPTGPTFNVTVNASAGTADEIAEKVRSTTQDMWDQEMRQAAGGATP